MDILSKIKDTLGKKHIVTTAQLLIEVPIIAYICFENDIRKKIIALCLLLAVSIGYSAIKSKSKSTAKIIINISLIIILVIQVIKLIGFI
jgi:hypothetical protein